MANLEWTLKLPTDQHFEAKVSFMYDNGLIKDLKELLNENQLNLFNQTCLRHFLQLPKLQNCGALVHSLLLREVVNEDIDDGSLRFLIGGEVLEFSERDFALILGLSMDQHVCLDVVVPKKNRLKTQYFVGVPKINLDAIWDAIETCEDDADRVKLAYVCFVEYFLLGKDKTSSYIDERHLDLVDDLKAFNTYLWGREVHARTFKFLRKAVALRSSIVLLREFLSSGMDMGNWSTEDINFSWKKMAVELYSGNHYV